MRRLVLVLSGLVLLMGTVEAQTLTPQQKAALVAAIQADSVANDFYVNGNLSGLATHMNGDAEPDFWIWRIAVSRADVYNTADHEGGTWNWTTYKNQSVTEQNAWTQIFMGDQADFSQANVRAGVAAIFTGSAQANAQRDHILSIGRKRATRFEKVFGVGAGSTLSPATPGLDANGQRITGPVSFAVFIGL